MVLVWVTIICFALYIILAPLYIYGFIRWYQWRKQFFFRLRYSYPEGLILVILSLGAVHLSLIHFFLHDAKVISEHSSYQFYRVTFSIAYIVQGLVYYRTNLIFLTWKQYQVKLYTMGITTTQQHYTSFNATSPRKHSSSQLLLILAIGGGCIILFLYLTEVSILSVFSVWCFQFIIGIIVFIVVKVKKVRELLSCLYELYGMLACIAIIWLMVFFFPNEQFIRLAINVLEHLFAIFTLYAGLYVVYISEKTLKTSSKNEKLMLKVVVSSSHSVVESTAQKSNIDLNGKSLVQFLQNRTDYEMFSKYLALVWCLENLLFIERVCIFRWIVLKKMQQQNVCIEQQEREYYSLNFLFLENIYEAYNDILNKELNDEFSYDRDLLWSICHEIYKEFICYDAENEINIPHGVRYDLDYKLKTKDNIDENFQSYDEFLSLFTGSMDNTWSLLNTVYQFKFAKFLTTNTTV